MSKRQMVLGCGVTLYCNINKCSPFKKFPNIIVFVESGAGNCCDSMSFYLVYCLIQQKIILGIYSVHVDSCRNHFQGRLALGILFCPLLIRGSSTYFGQQYPAHDHITNLHWQLFGQVSVFG